MLQEIIIAGFGGQGVLSMGQILSYAGMIEKKEVCWMPSYGPEMRGGTANCITIISDDMISSPIVSKFNTAVILNQPSLDKFEKMLYPGGVLIYDTNNIINPPTRKDITVYSIPASDEAVKLKNSRVMNVIMLGAVLETTKILKIESIMAGLKKTLPERYHHLLPLNETALKKGMELAKAI
jgi:2-oxoglutarate ferredoxin oxidoreductase subunit gamma